MARATFQTNPFALNELLDDCHRGVLQLPDFQRSWVWDEERIRSLIASVSRAFPVGALMSLNTGGPVNFKPRPVEGAPAEAKQTVPHSLLLDGQQRMTSLYQVTLRGKVVETVTPKNKKVKRWFYIDIRKTLDPSVEREEAIVGVPEDRIVRTDFGREVVLDLSSAEQEYASFMYPVAQVFDWDKWQDGFDKHWRGDQNENVREEFRTFKRQVTPRSASATIATAAGCDPEADRNRTLHGTAWGRPGEGLQLPLTLWNKLTRFLEYPELELSNNLAENSMRPVAIGRRNWIHIGSSQAGPKIAAILSVVESCRRLKLPVRDYLAAVLPGLADLPIQRLPELTPTAWVAQRSWT